MTNWRYEFIHQLVLQMDWKEETDESRLRRPNFQVNLANPEGHRIVADLSKPLPLGGPPDFGLKEQYRHYELRMNGTMILVLIMVFLTGGSSVNNSTSQDTMHPLIAVKSDPTYGFSV
ncbi:hypothetical protein Tco_1492808 [Tanacetum coccineum]